MVARSLHLFPLSAHRIITSKCYMYSVGLAYPAARGIGAIGQL